jgi:hypothetical protein
MIAFIVALLSLSWFATYGLGGLFYGFLWFDANWGNYVLYPLLALALALVLFLGLVTVVAYFQPVGVIV